MTNSAGIHSVRLHPDLNGRLQELAEERGQTLSDVIRTAALTYLGECPTCGQAIPARTGGSHE